MENNTALTDLIEPASTSSRFQNTGQEMHQFISKLYPICRSITGNGVRATLGLIKERIPLTIHEVPTGTRVFDWSVPREWNIREAYVKNSRGEKTIDFARSNLHVVSYSVPFRGTLTLSELKEHLFSLPDYPDWIPYRTSYYKENWGFCLTHKQLAELKDGEYDVCIDASLEDGFLTYGEYYLPGQTPDEVLISAHVCHPSLCNDNLSAIAVMTFLAKALSLSSLKRSYRFLFIPGTIGSITWLSLNEKRVHRIKHGLVLAGLGDQGNFTYKRSRAGDTEIDRAVTHVLKHSGRGYATIDFFPYGYDERQYCSPAFNLPVGCLMRTPHGQYPEYHTSADNLSFVLPASLADSYALCMSVFHDLENNNTYLNQNPKCEPCLGKRGLYGSIGGVADQAADQMAMLWVLNLSDGSNSLLDIAERSGLPFGSIKKAADVLEKRDLLRPAPERTSCAH